MKSKTVSTVDYFIELSTGEIGAVNFYLVYQGTAHAVVTIDNVIFSYEQPPDRERVNSGTRRLNRAVPAVVEQPPDRERGRSDRCRSQTPDRDRDRERGRSDRSRPQAPDRDRERDRSGRSRRSRPQAPNGDRTNYYGRDRLNRAVPTFAQQIPDRDRANYGRHRLNVTIGEQESDLTRGRSDNVNI